MPERPDPFSTFDFSQALAIVAAVSGGSDSTALLFLLKHHLDRLGIAERLLAVTVDHRLRTGSAAEAACVGRLAASLGVPHRIVTWDGAKPATGLAAAAREARYRLLAQAAGEAGASIIATGHTADDQAETVSMRAGRGAGRGLAAMAPATLHHSGSWIVRPLLAMRREYLRDVLRNAGLSWADDPTNADTSYERPRIRAALGRSDAPASVADLLERARMAAREREASGQKAAALIARHARLVSPGLVRLDHDFAAEPDGQPALYALRILLAAMGGVSQLPETSSTAALLARFGGTPFRATLSRTVVDQRASGIFLRRERRGLPAPARLGTGDLWDGRYRIESAGRGPGNIAVGLTDSKTADLASAFEPGIAGSLVRAAALCRPALKSPSRDSADGWTARPLLAPWANLLPCFDLAPARALAVLLGADLPPEPPFAQHNIRSA